MNIFDFDCDSGLKKKDIFCESKIKDYRVIHDKYAVLYNKNNTEIEKRNYSVELITLRNGYQSQAKLMNDRIKSDLGSLQWKVYHLNETLWNKHYGSKEEKENADSKLSDRKALNALEFVNSCMRSLFIAVKGIETNGIEELKALEASYDNLFKALETEKEVINRHIRQLRDALQKCKEYSTIMAHVDSLSFLIREIAINSYPDTLDIYKELSVNEMDVLLRGLSKSITDHIREFADYKAEYAKRYTADDYFEYIMYYQKFEGLPNQRAQAKREASKKQERLKNIKGQTLEPLEDQWKDFLASRTLYD